MTTQPPPSAQAEEQVFNEPQWAAENIQPRDYLQFAIPGVEYSAVRVHLSGHMDDDMSRLTDAIAVAEGFLSTFSSVWPPKPPPQPQQVRTQQQPPPQQQQRPQGQQRPPQQQQRPQGQQGGQQSRFRPTGGGGGQQRQTRASQYPLVVGWQCDICGGPCGRYPRTGNMTSDKVVCLQQCRDGTYIHTVGWLDEDTSDEGYVDPSDLPF